MSKKISYKDQRLTEAQQKKSKAIKSAGIKNYLGEQENVTVPKKWLSSPDHVVAELAYITPREQKILLDADLYGSLKGEPNRGPGGIMSLQGAGDGGGVESDGKGGHTGTGGGSGGKGPGPQGDFRSNAQHTGLKGDYSKDRSVEGDTSAFDFDNRTQTYTLSKDPKDQQAVNDYVQGKLGYQAGKKPSFFNNPFQSLGVKNNIYQRRANVNLAQKRAFQKYQDIEKYVDLMDDYGLTAEEIAEKVAANPSYGYDFSDLAKGKSKLGSNIGTNIEKFRENLYDVNPSTSYSMIQSILNKTRPDTQVTAMNTLGKEFGIPVIDDCIEAFGSELNGNLGNSNLTGQVIGGDDDGQQPYLPINYNTGAGTTEEIPEDTGPEYRFGTGQGIGRDVTLGYLADWWKSQKS